MNNRQRGRESEETRMYIGWDNREYEDPEMDAMREDAKQACRETPAWTGDDIRSHDEWLSTQDVPTLYEVSTLPWPGCGSLVQEFCYRVDSLGQVVVGQGWNEEAQAALQALVDYRGPEVRTPGRGNSLEEATEEESRLALVLALALLSPEQRQEYHRQEEQEARFEQALALVREAHQPVSFDPVFTLGGVVELEDGTGLVEVADAGPNWTFRFTQYILALALDISILQAYTPCGEHSFNRHFQITEKAPDESHQFPDFFATLAHLWRGLDWLLIERGEVVNETARHL